MADDKTPAAKTPPAKAPNVGTTPAKAPPADLTGEFSQTAKPGKAPKFNTPALRIAAKAEGFRRAGMAHSTTATDHKAGTFSPADVEALKADPMLVVVELG